MKEYVKLARAATLTAAVWVILGCSDDPAHQTQKKIYQKTSEAAAMLTYKGDLEGARTQLEQALSTSGTPTVREPAYLTLGALEVDNLQRQAAQLEAAKQPALNSLLQITEQIYRIEKLRAEQQRVAQLIESNEKEMEELQQSLEGGGSFGHGLRSELTTAQEELAALKASRDEWAAKAAAADEQLSLLQAQAEDYFQKAKTAGPDKRAELEKTGYEILLQKKGFYSDKQEAVTQVAMLERQIALLEPRVQRLAQAVEDIQNKLEALRQSAQLAQLRVAHQQLAEQIQQEMATLRQMVSALRGHIQSYQQQHEQVSATLEKVLETYEQVRSPNTLPAVLYRKGQLQSLAGRLAGSRLQFELSMSMSIEQLIQAAGEDADAAEILREAVLTVAEDEWLSKAMAAFDQADEVFGRALAEERTLGGEAGKQFAANVTASRLLNLHSKMKLADSLDRYELAETTEAALKEQMQKAAELGPLLAQSETMRILEKGLQYLPQMPYDSELFFESIRPQLTAWKQAQGTPQEREQAARQALTLIEQFEANADEKLRGLLQAEKDAVKAAIARGFEEPTIAPVTTNEPNQF